MIEKLLDYLDEVSILTIVGVNLLTVEVLQTASRTSDPLCELIQKALGFGQSQTFQQQREKVQRMSNTLLARLDNPEPLLLEVLDVICAEHKYGNRRIRDSGFIKALTMPPTTTRSLSSGSAALSTTTTWSPPLASSFLRTVRLLLPSVLQSSLLSRLS